ncbi:MAG: DUF349 domain-containing protein [Muribaculaceae bacterium]|nr:DUF349 domain-containing protein [Muribaculaceae bacterium]MDE5857884.1 DUF349 domain-containing protein [Muribaculaceae bacterium]
MDTNPQLPEPENLADGVNADVENNTGSTSRKSKEEILVLLAELSLRESDDISRDEVTRLKQAYYVARHAEIEALKAEFEQNEENKDSQFVVPDDTGEERLKELLNTIREKKAELARRVETMQNENLARKKAIIEQIAMMCDDTDNINREFPRFRELQQEFKALGEVPPTAVSETWKSYQETVERFYDQLKINKDLRDYDFKKNLEAKEALCYEAELLGNSEDVVEAFRSLQELHEKWREIGPVDKEFRESIWTRFREASSVVNKKYQAFFEERKQKEQENEKAKTELCELVEGIDTESLKSASAWDNATRRLLDAQAKWKTIGFCSRKLNKTIFDRFRSACDKFFAKKSEFYSTYRNELDENLARKTALCEKAEALKDSTDWKATAEKLIELQKEWKTIGTVHKRVSDQIWKRFTAACETFFEKRKAANQEVRGVETANLKAKKAIIASLREITDETPRDTAIAAVKDAISRWQSIGHVPMRDKTKINDTYHGLIDQLYEKFDIRQQRESMSRFESSVSSMKGNSSRMLSEREKLVRAYEKKTAELSTFENNMGFFTSKSKSGDSMMKEMERRIARIKEELESLKQKIKIVDENLD